MFNPQWTPRVIWRYTLFQIPGIALIIIGLLIVEYWFDLPLWVSIGLPAVWIIKDIVVFPFVWRAYDPDPTRTAHSMIGLRGVVVKPLEPRGQVRIRGEWWWARRASGYDELPEGTPIRVVDLDGLTLIVEPE